jgi:hypothetical protein
MNERLVSNARLVVPMCFVPPVKHEVNDHMSLVARARCAVDSAVSAGISFENRHILQR